MKEVVEAQVAKSFYGEKAWEAMTRDQREWAIVCAGRAINTYLEHSLGETKTLTNGDLKMELSNRKVEYRGAVVTLGPKLYDVLKCFMLKVGQALPAEQILRDVWGPAYRGERQYLRVAIHDIRERIPGMKIVCKDGFCVKEAM